VPSSIAKELALGSIREYKDLWNKADNKEKSYKSNLDIFEHEQNSSSATIEDPQYKAKLYRKIELLKKKVEEEKFNKKKSKSEIENLEVQTWKQTLTDPSEDSVMNVKDRPKEKSEQLDPARFKKKKLLYA
jgi:hypothetical protein